MAEIIYDCLVEDGVNLYDDLTEEKFEEKISKEYEYVNGIRISCGWLPVILPIRKLMAMCLPK